MKIKVIIEHGLNKFDVYQVTSYGNEKHIRTMGSVDEMSPADIYIQGFKDGSNKIVYAEVE